MGGGLEIEESCGRRTGDERNGVELKAEFKCPNGSWRWISLVKETSSNTAEVPSPMGDWVLMPSQMDAG